MSAWTKEKKFLICRRLFSGLLSLALLLICFSVFPVKSLAAEDFSWESLSCSARFSELISGSYVTSWHLGTTFNYEGKNNCIFRFGITTNDVSDAYAHIPVSSDLSDIVIYSRMQIESGVPDPVYDLYYVLSATCYDESGNLLGLVIRGVQNDGYLEYLSISGVEFPLGTASFTVSAWLGSNTSVPVTSSMYGVSGVKRISCAFTLISSDGVFTTDNWGTDNPYPFLFSHENQNIYLEKDGRIDFFVAFRGFNALSMHVVARTFADTTKYDLVYGDNFNYVFLSAVPPDTDEAAILCFDFYIQGNFVYTAPACAIHFSGWTGSGDSGGGGSGGDIADGELLDYLEEVKLSQEQVTEKIDALQTAMDNLPDKIENSMQNALDKEKNEANSTGSDLVGQLTDVIPNYSEGFVTALGNFASNFSYEGTDVVLTIPQIRFPEIPGKVKGPPLVKSFVMMDEKQVDFSEFVEMIPEQLLLLVQCLFTAALIVFCGKELYDTISYVLTLRKGE